MKHIKESIGTLYISSFLDYMDDDGKYDVIWNLAEELASYASSQNQKTGANVICGEIPDYDIPTNPALFYKQLVIVHNALVEGQRVLIHCMGGHGRTGIGLDCILMMQGYSAEKALAFTKKVCHGPETEEQIEFVKTFEKEFIQKL